MINTSLQENEIFASERAYQSWLSLKNTPKAFANFSPGLEREQQPWVTIPKSR